MPEEVEEKAPYVEAVEFLQELSGRIAAAGIPEADQPGVEFSPYGGVVLTAWLWSYVHHEDKEKQAKQRRLDLEKRIGALVALFPDAVWEKNDPTASPYDAGYYELIGKDGKVRIKLVTSRGDVCERVVVMEREVEKEVPDPELVKEIPMVKVKTTEEIVEWQCNKVLADATSPVKAPVTT